jgi:hypothetical protein
MTKNTKSSIRLIHKSARYLWVFEIILAMLIAGVARAQADEIRIPEPRHRCGQRLRISGSLCTDAC